MANFLPFYIITILVFLSFFASAAYSHFILTPKERRRGDDIEMADLDAQWFPWRPSSIAHKPSVRRPDLVVPSFPEETAMSGGAGPGPASTVRSLRSEARSAGRSEGSGRCASGETLSSESKATTWIGNEETANEAQEPRRSGGVERKGKNMFAVESDDGPDGYKTATPKGKGLER